MKSRSVVAAMAIVLSVAACENDRSTKETVGGLGGTVLGGIIGAQFGSGSGRLIATGAGVLIGALAGSALGRKMEESDKQEANKAVVQAEEAEIGETTAWNNPDTGNSGTVTPVREGTTASGEYCREFEQTIVIDGETEKGTGVACRQEDGTWRIREQAQ